MSWERSSDVSRAQQHEKEWQHVEDNAEEGTGLRFYLLKSIDTESQASEEMERTAGPEKLLDRSVHHR